MKTIILLVLISVSVFSFDIKVTDIDDRSSTIYIAVFNSEDGFPYEGEKSTFVWKGTPEDAETGVETKLKSGSYAVVIYQDTDGNGKLSKKFYGAPKEPYGVTNGDKKPIRKPRFEDRVVEVEEGETLKIKLWNP